MNKARVVGRAQEARRTLWGLVAITVVILGLYAVWRQVTKPPFPAEVIAMTPDSFHSIQGQPVTPAGAPVAGVVRGTHLFLLAGDGLQVADRWQSGQGARAYTFALRAAPAGHAAAVRIDLEVLRRRIGPGKVELAPADALAQPITVVLP